jgi:hypothetical protein
LLIFLKSFRCSLFPDGIPSQLNALVYPLSLLGKSF